ncbi:hypothetical protein SAMN05428979_0840 [Stappia sp. ES.058]|nr:hypothetical protein SAMN05428979_0840 [Stappia sp. ES.058]
MTKAVSQADIIGRIEELANFYRLQGLMTEAERMERILIFALYEVEGNQCATSYISEMMPESIQRIIFREI